MAREPVGGVVQHRPVVATGGVRVGVATAAGSYANR